MSMAGQFDVPSYWCDKIFHNFSTAFNWFTSMKGWIFLMQNQIDKQCRLKYIALLHIFTKRAMLLTTTYGDETEMK